MKPEGKLNVPWKLWDYSDAKYSGDNNTCKIVAGYIVLINAAIVAWYSRSHKTVTLLVTEAVFYVVIDLFWRILVIYTILLCVVY